ncbi:hypothetical protein HMPREF3191_00716 [Veillonellaceae bacterium DNF00626]|nr:hypothetical protein HMPREF3191_00716 [Veillonellaceae bacterium DNF00626]
MNFFFPKGDFYLFDKLKFWESYLGFLKSFKMGMHLCFLYGIFWGLFYGKLKEKPSPYMEKVAIQKELTVEVSCYHVFLHVHGNHLL